MLCLAQVSGDFLIEFQGHAAKPFICRGRNMVSGSSSEIEIRNAGLRVTLPRIRILEILETAESRHLSAEDVYKKLLESPNHHIGLATVYRVLTQFEAAGIVERHNFDGNYSVFELANKEHHDHMVDVDSGQVIEFVNQDIEKLQIQIAEEHGYELVDHEFVLYVKRKNPEKPSKF